MSLCSLKPWFLPSADAILADNSAARYDPFGNYRTTPTTNPGTTAHGFTGHLHNNTGVYPTQNVGLIYMNARYYLPEVGRFISADTIVPDPENPQSYNRYSYVRNSPMSYTDPTGHKECGKDGHCQDNLSGNPFQQSLLSSWLYFKNNFQMPFDGKQSITLKFSPNHDGTDFGGDFTVLAPAKGTVSVAGADSPAGIWRLKNIKTGEIQEWSNFCSGDGCHEALSIPAQKRPDVTLLPEEMLASGAWEDDASDWSHIQGTQIEIEHGHRLRTIYYHTDVMVTKDMTVDAGDILGKTTNNGWSTGTHLHYSVVFTYQGKDFYLDPFIPPSSISHLLP